MKDWRQLARGIAWVATACLCASPMFAQQEGGDKPKPAAREYPPLIDVNGNQDESEQGGQTMQPDSWPVTGVQNVSLGAPEIRHSYWVPGIRYSNTVASAASNSAGSTQWNTTSYVSGDVSLLEAWSHSLLSASYSGGGFTSTDAAQGNGQYHQFSAAYEIDRRRWQGLFVDQFSYLPQSSFGFGGTSGLSTPGISGSLSVPLPGLQNAYVPGQSFLGATGARYSNAAAAQLAVRISRRGSITLAAVHGLLRFKQSGNVGSDTEIFNVGYNYALTRKDYVGLVYRFSAFHYPGDPQALGDHATLLVYGRKITGRMGLMLSGGPEITTFRVPLIISKQKISGTASASLIYAFHYSSVTLNYAYGVSSGSGVFSGANTNLLGANWARQLTRVWAASLNLQYAKSGKIQSAIGLTTPSFDSWLVGAGLNRPLGRTANLSLGYQAQIQGASSTFCFGTSCGASHTAHQIILSFQWHASPLVLR
jgi:hypothetical protein